MTAVKAVTEALYCGASIETINVPFQLWLLQRNVKRCKDFEGLLRRSIKLQTLQESFSSNLMQRPGGPSGGEPGSARAKAPRADGGAVRLRAGARTRGVRRVLK